MSKTETDVKADIIAALEPLDDEVRARVLLWALRRFAPSLLTEEDSHG